IVEDDCLIGMGAILLNGVRVGTGSIVGAGALCPEGWQIPPNSLAVGIPPRVICQTTAAGRARVRRTVEAYLDLQDRHRAGAFAGVASPELGGHSRESKQAHHENITGASRPSS